MRMSVRKILVDEFRKFIPNLSAQSHKGQCGRIGIVGGSLEYTGAPYFAGITALRIGADLVHIFCSQSAAIPIKTYSPELIVHPILDTVDGEKQFENWVTRLHAIVIGPGLGRAPYLLQFIKDIVRICSPLKIPLIFDGDGLFFLNDNLEILKNYPNCILTPNNMEFRRLIGTDVVEFNKNDDAGGGQRKTIPQILNELGPGVTVLEKGLQDRFYSGPDNQIIDLRCSGSPRRCGGQGDLLSGATAVFYFWALQSKVDDPARLACYASSFLVRKCSEFAYGIKGRSMLATDMIEEIPNVIKKFYD